MTARVIKGSKQQIAQQVADMEGDVREAIVFVEEPAGAVTSEPVPATVEEMFKEMEPYMSHGDGDVDYSREGIYSRKPGE
jgi:hypothetical protein